MPGAVPGGAGVMRAGTLRPGGMIGPVGSALPVGREVLIPDQLSVAIDEGGIRRLKMACL